MLSRTHFGTCGIFACARVTRRKCSPVVILATGAGVAKVSPSLRSLRRLRVEEVVTRRWCRRGTGRVVVVRVGGGPVMRRSVAHLPNSCDVQLTSNFSIQQQQQLLACGRPLATRPPMMRDVVCFPTFMWRLCRDAEGSDTSHLGMWSVGRGEENRLLLVNMSRFGVDISRGDWASKSLK